jgi:hypothetical protein
LEYILITLSTQKQVLNQMKIPEGPAKADAKTPDGSTIIVMDLSFICLGRHLDFGVRFGQIFLY